MATSTSASHEHEPLRKQLDDGCPERMFPLDGPADLLRLVANSRGVFVVDESEFLALELVLTVGESLSFPYDNVDSLVADIFTALRDAS